MGGVPWQDSSNPLNRVQAAATITCGDVLDPLTVTCTSTSSGDISLRIGWDASLGSEDLYAFVANHDLYSDVFHTYDDLAEGSTVTDFGWNTTSSPTGGPVVTFTKMRTPGNIFGDALGDEPTSYRFSLPNRPDVATASITIPGSSGDLASVCPSPAVSLSDAALTVAEGASVRVGAVLDNAPTAPASVRFTLAGAVNGGGSCTTGADFYVSATEFAFNSGDTATSVTFTACDDTDADDETVALELVAAGISGLLLGSPTTMRVTIADDDCPAGEHRHEADPDATGPYCHSDGHLGPPLCDANLAQTWRLHSGGGHIDRVTAPCPLPTVTASLTGPAGLRLSLTISVTADAANPREFRVYTTNNGCASADADCAVPGVHYHAAIKSDEDCSTDAELLTFTSNTAQTVYLCTLIDVNHGISDRLLDVVVQDTHLLRGSVHVIEAARIEPPMRGAQ